jgi:hygromycin-B 7''-O-kinase
MWRFSTNTSTRFWPDLAVGMESLLPRFASGEEFEAFSHTLVGYLPAVREICQRHGLSADKVEKIDDGSVPVFYVGAAFVLKMSPPLWAEKITAEIGILQHLEGKISAPTPQVVHAGEMEGWRYFFMSRLQGQRLVQVLPSLNEKEASTVYAAMGQAIQQMHSLPPILDALPVPDWRDFVPVQVASCQKRQAGDQVGVNLIDEIPDFLSRYIKNDPDVAYESLLHTELFDPVWFVERRLGAWCPSGLFDFGDAMRGDPRGDFPCRMFDAHRLDAYLRGYGYAQSELTGELSCTMLAYFLLHRYANLAWLFKQRPEYLLRAGSLEELAQVAFPLRGT